MPFKKNNWSYDVVSLACKSSFTYYDAAVKCGARPSGGNIQTLKSKICLYGIDVSHFYCNSVGRYSAGPIKRKGAYSVEFDDLKRNKDRLRRITRETGWRCDSCLLSDWMGEKIALEVHHIDGDNKNNRRENISILCPNCHALTDNWRGRNKVP